jgi:hypothetical protein
MGLMLSYYGKDGPFGNSERRFSVLVNGVEIREVVLRGEGADAAVDEVYPIPAAALAGLEAEGGQSQVEVKLVSKADNRYVGGIVELRTIYIK